MAERQLYVADTQIAEGAYTPEFVKGRSAIMAIIAANLIHAEYVDDLENLDPNRKHTILPHETVVGQKEREKFKIESNTDVIGGWVSHGFLATKAIMHPAIDAQAQVPEGWNESNTQEFASAVKDHTLPGYSAFNWNDIVYGWVLLKNQYPNEDIRIKKNAEAGGLGQKVIHSYEELVAFAASINEEELSNSGVVLEVNLVDADPRIITGSVGSLEINGIKLSYLGSQRIDPNPGEGKESYLGSDLIVTRGTMADLVNLPDDFISEDHEYNDKLRKMATSAHHFDAATTDILNGNVIASRRNYDVLWGKGEKDQSGEAKEYYGVVDQSWRVGGATGAELIAACIFQSEQNAVAVKASTYHVFEDEPIPEGAVVFVENYDGDDGPKNIYTVLHEIRYSDGSIWKRETDFGNSDYGLGVGCAG